MALQLLVRVIRGLGDVDTRLNLLEGLVENMTPQDAEGRVGGPVYEALISTYASLDMIDDAFEKKRLR